MSIYEQFDELVENALTKRSQADLKKLADWFMTYNDYDFGGEFYNIDGSYGLRVNRVAADDGTEEITCELVNFDDL